MKKSKAAVILVAILAAFAGLAYYASIILSSTGIGEEMSIPLGLYYMASDFFYRHPEFMEKLE